MARINVEDSIYSDIRFNDLVQKLNCVDTAIGSLVRAWTLAQKWFIKEDRMIPLTEWKKNRINDALIEVGLAEIIGDHVRVAGAEEQFGWLKQRSDAGRRSGIVRQNQAIERHRTTVQSRSTTVQPVEPLPHSLPHTHNTLIQGEVAEAAVKPKFCLMDLWNKNCGDLPKCKGLSKARRAKMSQRLTEIRGTDDWLRVIEKLKNSDFCNGANDRGWRADFDFLLKPDTPLRALEGKYDNMAKATPKNWDYEAMKVFEAVRKYGATKAGNEALGDHLSELTRAAGGLSRVGQMPANDFSVKKLAGLLKAASESNQTPSQQQGAKNARGLCEGRREHGDQGQEDDTAFGEVDIGS